MPQRRSPASRSASAPAVRRPRGEPRRLLLDAARELFARKDYRSTTTREIAESAGVTEYLLFRHFGSKAGLFREALVLPFTNIVDEFAQDVADSRSRGDRRRRTGPPFRRTASTTWSSNTGGFC